MMFKSVTAVAFLAVASHALADEAATFKMSARELFGMGRRQTDTGYTPTDTFCGMGATCAEACGAGFEMCASNDNSIHCFNAQAKQICCPDGSGSEFCPRALIVLFFLADASDLAKTRAMPATSAPVLSPTAPPSAVSMASRWMSAPSLTTSPAP